MILVGMWSKVSKSVAIQRAIIDIELLRSAQQMLVRTSGSTHFSSSINRKHGAAGGHRKRLIRGNPSLNFY